MRFSFLKTLFLCLVKEFLFLFWSHLGNYTSDMGHKFLCVHFLWQGVGWSIRWGRCCQGSGSGSFSFFLLICPALLQLKQSPLFIMSPHLSMFNASTSIASGSRHWMFHLCFGSSFPFSGIFPVNRPRIHCIFL